VCIGGRLLAFACISDPVARLYFRDVAWQVGSHPGLVTHAPDRVYPNFPSHLQGSEPQIGTAACMCLVGSSLASAATVPFSAFSGSAAPMTQSEQIRKRGDEHAYGLQTQVSRIKEVARPCSVAVLSPLLRSACRSRRRYGEATRLQRH
jgi:hypothetical protein